MDRATSPSNAPVADRCPAVMLEAEPLTLPPLYRSEGFAEDLFDDTVEPAVRRTGRAPAAWLYVAPLGAAMVGALASTLVALA